MKAFYLRMDRKNSKQTGTLLRVPVCLLCLCCLLWQTLLPAFSQTYDLRGRMTLKQPDARLNEATLTWSYPNENTRIATRGSLQTTYTSNPQRGWLQSVQSPTGTISYGYDDGGQKTSVASASGVSSYSYDVLGRVQNVYDQPTGASTATAIASYDYDNVGNLKSVSRGNGIVTSYGYDELNRLSDMVNAKGASEVSRFHYPVRADGKRTGLTERLVNADLVNNAPRVSNRAVTYGYDDAGRLTGEAGDDGLGVAYQTSYTYDKVGNRTDTLYKRATTAAPNTLSRTTTVASVFNANDWLTGQSIQNDGGAVQTQSYTYDRSGSQLTEQNGSSTPQENDWGFDGKLQGTKTQGQSTGGTSYTTDAAGNRIGVTLNTGLAQQKTTRYLVDENTSYAGVVEERAPDTNDTAAQELQARYVWGGGLAPLAMWRKGSDGTVRLFFMLTDGQDSVRQLTNSSGSVTDSYFYDAWGNGLGGGSGTTVNPFRYTGQQLDPSGKYFLRARYYDPGTGRFLSQDPLKGDTTDPVSLHRYVYASVEPVDNADPSGEMTLAETNSVMGSMANLSRTAVNVLRAIDKARSVVDAIQTIEQTFAFLTSGQLQAEMQAAMGNVRGGLTTAGRRAMMSALSDAIESLEQNLPSILSRAFVPWSAWLAAHGKQVNGLLLYLPNPGLFGYFKVPTGLKLGNWKVYLVSQGRKHWGTVTGVGFQAPGLKGTNQDQQVWRMDYHAWNPGHGSGSSMANPGEISVWQDGDFHYHVLEPNYAMT